METLKKRLQEEEAKNSTADQEIKKLRNQIQQVEGKTIIIQIHVLINYIIR